ncbi:MAG TPA: hypothetical protein VGM81_00985 [Burkholderiaceae bacterium]|jgi:hypothetical protein
MEKIHKDWLQKLGVEATAQVAVDKREERKQALIGKLSSDRETQAEQLLAGSKLKYAKGRKKQKGLDLENRDQTAEFDLDEQRDGYALVDGDAQENFQKHLQTARIVDQLVREMQAEMSGEVDKDGKPIPLFSAEEIKAQVYDPLLRRGLIAETNVPNEYSRTKELLDASFAAYAERLKKDKLSTGKRLFKENFSLAKTMVGSVATITSGSLSLEAKMDQSGDELATSWKPDDNIKAIHQGLGQAARDGKDGYATTATTAMIDNARMGFATQALSFVTDVGIEGSQTLAEKLGSEATEETKERVKVSGALAQALVGAASSELGDALSASGLALEVGSTFGTLVNTGAITRALQTPEFTAVQVTAISTQLAAACKATLIKLDPKVGTSTAALTTTGSEIVSAMAGAPAPEGVLAAFEKGAFDKAVELYAKALNVAVVAAVTKNNLLDVLKTDEARNKVMAAAAEAMTEAFNKPDEDEPPDDVKHTHDGISSHKPEWTFGKAGWVCSICASSNSEDPAVFAGILNAKLERLKKDQERLKWAATLVGMGIDTAANFIAPLAIVGCALKMARNLYEAATRTRDLINFIEDRQGMFNAASAFSAPVTQFIRNAGIQQTHYYANAGFEGAKMIGAIIQCTGAMAAPAGVVVSASANIAQAIEAVLYEASKRLMLEVAWSDYKNALSRPENRKMGLVALKNNPTLAKYAVAWGAVIKQDPLVSDFMGSCGLGVDALRDPEANLDKVVQYLETRMPDDNVVTGRSIDEPAATWAPAALELTAKSWITVKSLAEARGALEPQDTLTLEAALQRYEAASPALLVAAKTKPVAVDPVQQKQQQDWLALLSQLNSLVGRVSIVMTKEAGAGQSVEMDEVKNKFKKMIQAHRDIGDAWVPPKPKT